MAMKSFLLNVTFVCGLILSVAAPAFALPVAVRIQGLGVVTNYGLAIDAWTDHDVGDTIDPNSDGQLTLVNPQNQALMKSIGLNLEFKNLAFAAHDGALHVVFVYGDDMKKFTIDQMVAELSAKTGQKLLKPAKVATNYNLYFAVLKSDPSSKDANKGLHVVLIDTMYAQVVPKPLSP